MSRSLLALLALAALGTRGIAQAPPTPRLEFGSYTVAFTPRNSLDRATMSNVAIGGQVALALTSRTQLVGGGFGASGVATSPDSRTRVQAWQLELGIRRVLHGAVVATTPLRVYAGAGAAARLYDLAAPGFPDLTRFGAYASLGIRVPALGRTLDVESRTYLFERDAGHGGRSIRTDIANAVGVSLRVR